MFHSYIRILLIVVTYHSRKSNTVIPCKTYKYSETVGHYEDIELFIVTPGKYAMN